MASQVLNVPAVPNAYSAASTLDGLPPCKKLNLDISNASIFMQLKVANLGVAPGGESWGPEMGPLIPTTRNYTRAAGITGIRVRAAVASLAVPAAVFIELVPFLDLGELPPKGRQGS